MNLYNLIGAAPSPAPIAVNTNPGVDSWVSEGCYSDEVGARTLASTVSVSGSMTVKVCVDACKAAGYSLAGVEYGSQCYCDNAYTNGAASRVRAVAIWLVPETRVNIVEDLVR